MPGSLTVLGLPIASPQALATRALDDLAAVERLIRVLPGQIDRALGLAQELVLIGNRVLEIGERLDRQGQTISRIGERLDERASQMLSLGQSMEGLGNQIDVRGAEIVVQAAAVTETARELLLVLPTLERALDLATPLEGAIDRFGRLVDRFPGPGRSRDREG